MKPTLASSPVATQWLDIATGFAGYLALPPAGRGPGLAAVAEIFGVNAHIRAVAEQYALDGFVVLAPDVFWREAPRVELGYEGEDRERALRLMRLRRRRWRAPTCTRPCRLRARAEVQGRVGCLGYCMGGRLAYLTAATAVSTPRWPTTAAASRTCWHLAAVMCTCPMQFHYAELDDNISRRGRAACAPWRCGRPNCMSMPGRGTASTAGPVPPTTHPARHWPTAAR